jgi:hypothetical protein
VKRLGLANILKQFHEFELDRYGSPCTSRYFLEGWDKKEAG